MNYINSLSFWLFEKAKNQKNRSVTILKCEGNRNKKASQLERLYY